MMKHSARALRASLFRDWLVFRTWLWTLMLIAIVGPVFNWLGAISNATAGNRLRAAFSALYNGMPFGRLVLRHGQIIAIDYRPQVPVSMHGFGTVGVWVIASSVTLGVILATLDRHNQMALDQRNEPLSPRTGFLAKIILGSLTVLAFSVARSVFVGLTVAMSPYHLPLSLVGFSFLTTVTISLVTFAIGLLAGVLVGNAFLGWMSAFLFLVLPIALQAMIGYLIVWVGKRTLDGRGIVRHKRLERTRVSS